MDNKIIIQDGGFFFINPSDLMILLLFTSLAYSLNKNTRYDSDVTEHNIIKSEPQQKVINKFNLKPKLLKLFENTNYKNNINNLLDKFNIKE
tara:strand:- start:1355 stop:1630 length:276 start_codon:yes stop_codon:yes gene_type:complete